LLLNHGIDVFGSCQQKRGFEEVEGLQLGLSAVGAEPLLALAQLAPSCGDRDQFLMQSRGPWAVETKASHQDHAGYGIVALRQAGPGEVVVNEPLSGESAKQTPDNAVFQMEVNDVLVHGPGVVEDYRPDRRLPSPLPGLLVAIAGRPERVHRLGPGRVGSLALIEGGKRETVNRLVPVLPSRQWLQEGFPVPA